MNEWTTSLRPGLPIAYGGEQFTDIAPGVTFTRVPWPATEAGHECHYLGAAPRDTAALLVRHGFLVPSRRQTEPPVGRLRGAAIETWHRWASGEAHEPEEAVTDALVRYGFLYRCPDGAAQPRTTYLTHGQAV